MPKLGLKLWSTNRALLAPARELYRRGVFDYLELYVAPGSVAHLAMWIDQPWPTALHAPHSHSGFNLARPECAEGNRRLLAEVEQYRAALAPPWTVMHPGIQGTVEETVRQVGVFRPEFPQLFAGVLVENKPRVGLHGELCNGASPEEIRQVIDGGGLGFCLDIPHAICYAAWAGEPWEAVVWRFLEFGPTVVHLSDGDVRATRDSHPHLGQGNFDLGLIGRLIPPAAYLTVETKKDSETDLDDFVRDMEVLKGCLP